MRIPDETLQCVGFVCEFIETSTGEPVFEPEGTGFFVSIPSSTVGNKFQHMLFVTAKHVAHSLQSRETVITVNKAGGGIGVIQRMGDRWYLHPDDSVDVAVLVCGVERGLDIRSIPTEMFLTEELMEEKRIGVGDEVYFPGLFAFSPNEKHNLPIVRHGNIAMIPKEPIQIEGGFAEVYLMEARSIGGISGSPVFVRGTKTFLNKNDGQMMNGISGESYLLGLVHGHWDIKESEINSPKPRHDPKRGVNIGIGVVVPASRIIEAMNHPDLVQLRADWDAEIEKLIGPKSDKD